MKDRSGLQAVSPQPDNGLAALRAALGVVIIPALPEHGATIEQAAFFDRVVSQLG
jgi:hypothetical protein